MEEAFADWLSAFADFNEKWNHDLKVIRRESRRENFAFVCNRTLFIGLNLVGGRVHDKKEWRERLLDQSLWTKELVMTHVVGGHQDANSVVLIGHANPRDAHKDFFRPIVQFMRIELNDTVPFLYLNGDGHFWNYNGAYFSRPNFLRVQVTGGTDEPPLQVTVDNNNLARNASQVFVFDRRLS